MPAGTPSRSGKETAAFPEPIEASGAIPLPRPRLPRSCAARPSPYRGPPGIFMPRSRPSPLFPFTSSEKPARMPRGRPHTDEQPEAMASFCACRTQPVAEALQWIKELETGDPMPGSRRKSASTQGHTYVIDQSYRVVYLDRAARRVFPGGRVGELCYECFRGQANRARTAPGTPSRTSTRRKASSTARAREVGTR